MVLWYYGINRPLHFLRTVQHSTTAYAVVKHLKYILTIILYSHRKRSPGEQNPSHSWLLTSEHGRFISPPALDRNAACTPYSSTTGTAQSVWKVREMELMRFIPQGERQVSEIFFDCEGAFSPSYVLSHKKKFPQKKAFARML